MIGGNTDTCPLCQNMLSGEASPDNWPSPRRLRVKAFAYKLQLFIVLALTTIALSLDFLLDLNNGKHYSLLLALWLILFEMDLSGNMKRPFVVSRTVSISTFHLCILLLVTGWFLGFLPVSAYIITPSLLCASLAANLVFTMTDTTENALVYLLGNILLVIIAYAVLKLKYPEPGLLWTICLMLGFVAIIGTVIFKGRKVSDEIQKRMNF